MSERVGAVTAIAASLLAPKRHAGSGIDTTVIFALAILLIVNSHLEMYYPVPWLAADGLLGNTTFFFLSGFAIAKSLARPQSAGGYAWRRLTRIYPAVFVAVALGLAVGTLPMIGSAMDLVSLALWPTPFTYVMLIVPFYGVLWFIRYRLVLPLLLMGAAAALAAALFENVASGALNGRFVSQDLSQATFVTFFLLATLAGAQVARADIAARIGGVWLAAGCVVAYFALKFGLIVAGLDGRLSLIMLALCFGAVVTLALSLGDPAFVARVAALPLVGPLTVLIANLTLEIYVLHAVILTWPPLPQIVFPLNIVALCAATAVLALVVHVVLRLGLGRLDQLVTRRAKRAEAAGHG